MDIFKYLLKCSEEEILNTWEATGAIVVNNKTKLYIPNTVCRVDASDGSGVSTAKLHNAMIFINQSYRVDNKTFFPIDWETLSPDDLTGNLAAIEGIQLPYFGILPAKYSMAFIPDPNFIPYNNKEAAYDNGGVTISDAELETILAPLGFPFVEFDDLEYSKDQICKYMVRPAMEKYFAHRPIIVKQEGHSLSRGAEFAVPFPEGAYACVPYYTTPGGAGMGSGSKGSPFSIYSEMAIAGGYTAGSRFGRGIRYIGKQVPGFVGLESNNARIDNMLGRQGFLNFFRREHYDRVRDEKGKLWAVGYSTIGGNLNFIWLKSSTNWNDVRWEDLENIARPLVQIKVLRNLGLLRSLVKEDIAGQLDANVLLTQAKELEDRTDKLLNSLAMSHQFAIMRGGG